MNHFIIISSATILLLFFLSPLTTFAAKPAVLDLDGNAVRPNSSYYVLPVVRGKGGGLTVEPKNISELCPLTAAQETRVLNEGIPLIFHSVNPKDKKIFVSTDLNFVFDAVPLCVPSGPSFIWQLAIDEGTGRRYIGFGGELGNPGKDTVDNWFKIEKAGNGTYDYKIVFCPSVCNFCKVMCGDIGVFVDNHGRRLLDLNDQPLLVNFKKA